MERWKEAVEGKGESFGVWKETGRRVKRRLGRMGVEWKVNGVRWKEACIGLEAHSGLT